MKVTHVCRHWRAVALDYPFLWGNITYELGTQWTMLMMERAKYATISIRQSRWSDPTSAGEIYFIPEHISQIDELDLHGRSIELHKILDNLHRKPAPRLRYFAIDCRYTNQDDGLLSVQPIHLPEVLFDGQAPNLQFLNIYGPCRLSLSSPWLRDLHRLFLRTDRSVAILPAHTLRRLNFCRQFLIIASILRKSYPPSTNYTTYSTSCRGLRRSSLSIISQYILGFIQPVNNLALPIAWCLSQSSDGSASRAITLNACVSFRA